MYDSWVSELAEYDRLIAHERAKEQAADDARIAAAARRQVREYLARRAAAVAYQTTLAAIS